MQRWDNVNATSCDGQLRDVKLGFVCGEHDSAVWVSDADGIAGGTFVEDMGGDRTKMCRAATISNGSGIRGYNGWGGTYANSR